MLVDYHRTAHNTMKMTSRYHPTALRGHIYLWKAGSARSLRRSL
jgi:hypothetical protein